ncbi:MAG: gamma carbonic anhydrase family protein [Gammaproteobacteria bacterium]|nr:gamma carbonic anhydrase family protein [Gammaproteobacteria bacterium]MDH5513760.1 gamma carbonic anhydrase family protein [Gammaproteobacteria bacterium]
MTIRKFENSSPAIDPTAYIDETALVIGEVTIAADVSLWPKVVARGDVNTISIGARTNIQDGTILHVSHDSEFAPGGFPLVIGADITVGHQAILHGCTIEDGCLIGMAATVMDGAIVRSGAIVGAGSLVPPGKDLQGGYLWVGSPVRQARELRDEEKAFLEYSARHYVELKNRHMAGG